MKFKNNSAFTIVEIVVVITIIAILSSLAVITFNSVRQDSRDAKRQSNATIISEALEKYYEEHGEYPSVASIANNQPGNTGEVVSSLLSIPAGSLIMPNMPSTTTNGIISGAEPQNNYLAYEASSAVDNAGCQTSTSAGCDKFTLRYIEESSENVRVIESRRSSRSTGAAPEIDVAATSTSSIDATWTAIPGTTSYTLQRSLSNDMSSPVVSSHTTTTATASGLAPNTEYFFRVQAILPSGSSGWSGVESATTSTVPAPTGTITINAAMSGSNARGTAGGGSCSSGTLQRQIRYRVNMGTWSLWETTNQKDVAATQGYMYTFQAQARCVASSIGGPWKQSVTASVTRPVVAPTGALTIDAYMSGSYARGQAGGGTCASGTTIERQVRWRKTNTETDGAWQSYSSQNPRNLAADQGWKYTFEQRARCVGLGGNSAWANSTQDSTVRPITVKSNSMTISVSTVGNNTTFTTSPNTNCPVGTVPAYAWRYMTAPGTSYPNSWLLHHPDYDRNPRHNWGPPHPPDYGTSLPGGGLYFVPGTTTTRSFTWNTSAGNTNYHVSFQSWCQTVHYIGPWMDHGSEPYASYYRP